MTTVRETTRIASTILLALALGMCFPAFAWAVSGTVSIGAAVKITSGAANKANVAANGTYMVYQEGAAGSASIIRSNWANDSGRTTLAGPGNYYAPDINTAGTVVYQVNNSAQYNYVKVYGGAQYGPGPYTGSAGPYSGQTIGAYNNPTVDDNGYIYCERTNVMNSAVYMWRVNTALQISVQNPTSDGGAGSSTQRIWTFSSSTVGTVKTGTMYVNGGVVDANADCSGGSINTKGYYAYRRYYGGNYYIYGNFGNGVQQVYSSGATAVYDVHVTEVIGGYQWVYFIRYDSATGYDQVYRIPITYYGSNDSVAVSSDPITADGTTIYTVTAKSTISYSGGNNYGGTYGIMTIVFQDTTWTNARGYFAWHPSAYTFALDQGACPGGGFVSKNTGYGDTLVTLVPGSCSTSVAGDQRTVIFAFKASTNYGDVQGMDIAEYNSNVNDHQVGWTFTYLNFNVRPMGVTSVSGGNTGNAINSGTGNVTLSWSSSGSTATGYMVWIFDGNAYRGFDVGTALSVDSANALDPLYNVFPTDAEINSWGDNTIATDQFHHANDGAAFRDNPERFYEKTIGTTYDNSTNYWFRVTPYNSYWNPTGPEMIAGDSYVPTLPDRTAPFVTITSHTAGSTYYSNLTSVTVSGTSTDVYGLNNQAASWLSKIAYDIDGNNNTGTIDFDITTPEVWSNGFTGLTGKNILWFRAYDTAGNYNPWDTSINYWVDNVAPPVPGVPTLTSVSLSQIDVNWAIPGDLGAGTTPNDYTAGGVEVYITNSTNPVGGTDYGWGVATGYSDTGLQANSQYGYKIKARDTVNVTLHNTSADSAEVLIYTRPDKATGVAHTANTTDSLTWVWTAPVFGANGYKLTVNGATVDVGNVLTYVSNAANGFGTLNANTKYPATVTAYNTGGDAVVSDPITGNYTSIQTPTGVDTDNANYNSGWEIVLSADGQFNNLGVGLSALYAGTISGGAGLGPDSAWITTNQYADVGLVANTNYTYHFKARNGDGDETPWTADYIQTTAPAAPTAQAWDGIAATWTPPAGAANHRVQIYRDAAGPPNGQLVWETDTASALGNYPWGGAVSGKEYFFRTLAYVNSNGLWSGPWAVYEPPSGPGGTPFDNAPTAPTNVWVNDVKNGAQTDPGNGGSIVGDINTEDITPIVFAGQYNDDSWDSGVKVRVKVSTAALADPENDVPDIWDSGDVTVTSVKAGTRCSDILYRGPKLNDSQSYHVTMKMIEYIGTTNIERGTPWSTDTTFKIERKVFRTAVVNGPVIDPNTNVVEVQDNNVWRFAFIYDLGGSGTQVRVEYWRKLSGVSVGVELSAPSTTPDTTETLLSGPDANGWSKYELVITPGVTAGIAKLKITTTGTGSAYFDDILKTQQ